MNPLRYSILYDRESIRHSCGGRLVHRVTGAYVEYLECSCGSTWKLSTIWQFTIDELRARFSVIPAPGTVEGRLVWRSEGKAKFLSVAPADEAGEPSGLS
jgi:hypothetical protein